MTSLTTSGRLPNNRQILAHSQQHPEPLFEASYLKNFLVITTPPERANTLMEANRGLLDLITAYAVAKQHGESSICDGYISDMIPLLRVEGINYSEFASFWPVYDTSHSAFQAMTADEQRHLLHDLVEQYIELRHRAYGLHGYTATTLQVQADSFGHKHSGALARNKITRLLQKRGYGRAAPKEDGAMGSLDHRTFIFPDGGDRKAFAAFLDRTRIRFAWGKRHDGKRPDVVIFAQPHVFIVEHKHMKEGGGGQDKQIVELINFVEQSERHENETIHYVAFLDGTMANTLLAGRNAGRKLNAQLQHIERALRAHEENYFVNTAGFIALINAHVP